MVTGSSLNRNNFVSSSVRSGFGISDPLAGSEGPSRSHFEPHRNDLVHVSSFEHFLRPLNVDFNARIIEKAITKYTKKTL